MFFSDKNTALGYGFELIQEKGKEPVGVEHVVPAILNIETLITNKETTTGTAKRKLKKKIPM